MKKINIWEIALHIFLAFLMFYIIRFSSIIALLVGIVLLFFLVVYASTKEGERRPSDAVENKAWWEYGLRLGVGFIEITIMSELFWKLPYFIRANSVLAFLALIIPLLTINLIVFNHQRFWLLCFSHKKMVLQAQQRKIEQKEAVDEEVRLAELEEIRIQKLAINAEEYETNIYCLCVEEEFPFDFYENQIEFSEVASQSYRMRPDFEIESLEENYVWLPNEDRLAYLDQIIKEWHESLVPYDYLNLKPITAFDTYETTARLDHVLTQVYDYFEEFGSQYPNEGSEGALETLQRVYNMASFLRSYLNCRKNQITQDYIWMKIGLEGEDAVNEELKPHMNIINLTNIRVEVDGESIENDNILLSRQGIYTLEVKNFGTSGRFDIVIEADGRWLRRFENERVEVMKNVTSQSNRHIGYLNRLINEHFQTNLETFIETKGLIVIANERVTIENHNPRQVVIRKADIYNHIISQPVCLSLEEIQKIKTLLESQNLPSLKFPLPNYDREFKELIPQALAFCRKFELEVKKPFIDQVGQIALEHAEKALMGDK